jgi:hypothetical protein
MTDFDDELQCERCDGTYTLRTSKEPSRYCDDCAHAVAESGQCAITPNVQAYLRIVARIHVYGGNNVDDDTERDEERDNAWYILTKPERDTANAIVEAVFGEWL